MNNIYPRPCKACAEKLIEIYRGPRSGCYWCECTHCGVCGKAKETQQEAIEAWNSECAD